jgi:hypothetical protein
MSDVPVRTDAMSFWDTLSDVDKEALRRVDEIRERFIRRLYVRHARHGGRIEPSEIDDEAVEQARKKADAVLLCLIGLTQEGLDDPKASA